jgi:DNA replication and repair protein RecF
LTDYKNIKFLSVSFEPRVNVICGDNAQGKTNLLEAIWLCTGCRSFRGNKHKNIVKFGENKAEIAVGFTDKEREQSVTLRFNRDFNGNREIKLNGVNLKSLSELFGRLQCVAFTPDDLGIAKGSPEKRRDFLDISVSQIKPSYLSALNMYMNALSQRNAYLKNLWENPPDYGLIDIWDEQLAKAGAYLTVLRDIYCSKLSGYAAMLYEGMTKGKERLRLNYKSSVLDEIKGGVDYAGELKEAYLKALRKSLKNDLRTGFTTEGVHRDDIESHIDELPVREYASQGQSRSVAIVMKLAAAHILTDEKDDPPVLLLDDVLSELDAERQKFIFGNIGNMQTLITCCDEGVVSPYNQGAFFRISGGVIV